MQFQMRFLMYCTTEFCKENTFPFHAVGSVCKVGNVHDGSGFVFTVGVTSPSHWMCISYLRLGKKWPKFMFLVVSSMHALCGVGTMWQANIDYLKLSNIFINIYSIVL
jgi:hypothetical protein